ncbi:MAG: integration host factor subunit beta [Candidatus Omnitrophica bacterium]|nr:integration host factor subunit beta [Candidatus Omnitrophota bacterium]
MIKKDIVEEVAHKTGLNKSIIREITDKFLLVLYKALEEGKRVELRGFGVFEVKRIKGRKGRNPKTGEIVFIPERNKVVFKISKLYKKREGKLF